MINCCFAQFKFTRIPTTEKYKTNQMQVCVFAFCYYMGL